VPRRSGQTALRTARVSYLPMPKKTSKLKPTEFAALAEPGMAELIVRASEADRLQRVRADAERYPSRIFSNALVNTAWRNGTVEVILVRLRFVPLLRQAPSVGLRPSLPL